MTYLPTPSPLRSKIPSSKTLSEANGEAEGSRGQRDRFAEALNGEDVW